MVKVLISWLISAVILWLIAFLANQFSIPLMYITLSGVVGVLLVAVVLGLLNAFIIPVVKSWFKIKSAFVVLVVSLVIDAAFLLLMSWILSPRFYIPLSLDGFITALIVAAIMAVVNTVVSTQVKGK